MGALISSVHAASLFIKREWESDILTHFINISYLKALPPDTQKVFSIYTYTHTHTQMATTPNIHMRAHTHYMHTGLAAIYFRLWQLKNLTHKCIPLLTIYTYESKQQFDLTL